MRWLRTAPRRSRSRGTELALIAIVLTATVCSADGGDASDVVARFGARTITAQQLRCNEQALRGAVTCEQVQRDRFRSLATRELIDAAARLNHIAVSDEEVSRRMPHVDVASIAAAQRAAAEAALALAEGMSEQEVARRYLEPHHISREYVASFQKLAPTVADIKKSLAQDYAALTTEQLREQTRRQLAIEKLRRLVDERAAAQHQSRSAVAAQFWRDVEQQGVVVLDTRYQLPDMKGVLD